MAAPGLSSMNWQLKSRLFFTPSLKTKPKPGCLPSAECLRLLDISCLVLFFHLYSLWFLLSTEKRHNSEASDFRKAPYTPVLISEAFPLMPPQQSSIDARVNLHGSTCTISSQSGSAATPTVSEKSQDVACTMQEAAAK
ncbi:hypothetical protein UY3_11505 [Chelonia mydas]|uniref:Uncharacterized protein n=1 Tax=Chelonia mydas TaxID=8469 RepID=M7B0M3_CHEMY|nr:hypothetical protein UY3_11505 [Chelonia mydas]